MTATKRWKSDSADQHRFHLAKLVSRMTLGYMIHVVEMDAQNVSDGLYEC